MKESEFMEYVGNKTTACYNFEDADPKIIASFGYLVEDFVSDYAAFILGDNEDLCRKELADIING